MPTTANPSGNGRTGKKHAKTGGAVREVAAAALSPDAIMELIEKLGVKDLMVSHLRTRLESIDLDSIFDDAIDYVRRNPEVLVAILGAVTVSAGLIIFLNSRRPSEDDLEYELTPEPATTKTASRRRAASHEH